MSSEIQINEVQNLKRTPLFANHKELNAKMVPFGGWEMPVQYPAGLIAEHKAVRENVGIFDVSHMGEVFVTGKGSEEFLQEMTTNDISKIVPGQAQYNALCDEHGHMIDDIIIYKKSDNDFLICVNASNIKKDFEWLCQYNENKNVVVENLSEQYGQIAVQGPKSRVLLSKLLLSHGSSVSPRGSTMGPRVSDIAPLPYYHFFETKIFGAPCIVARTGYTGELGYEIYCPAQITSEIWNALLEQGKEESILPCGLGARDTLRLEVGYLLYGNDMDETITALECGLKWITKFDKKNFMGKDALFLQEKQGLSKKLVGFEMLDRAIGRHGYKVFHPVQTSKEIGIVTSGSPSPTLSKNIGLMYVTPEFSKLGSNVFIEIRGSLKPAQVVKKPFYTQGTVQS